MKSSKKDRFITIRSEGGILPLDFLERIALLNKEISGLSPGDYHLLEHEKINEAINRAWDRLLGCWVSYKASIKNAADDNPLIRETRERWLLPLFEALSYGRLTQSKAIEIDGRTFQISHMWQQVPIHLVGAGVELDRRTSGVVGASRATPHGMVQDFLNHSDEHLWAFVSNGKTLRLLRDNVSLTRQAFVEFDLEGMMDGEQFSDFRLLFLLCHQSRVEQDNCQDFWLERWTKEAQLAGVRVRDELGRGVEEAILALGSGFLQHPNNAELRNRLKSGKLSAPDYYRQILRTVYRLLFLFVAEDRDVLLRRKCSIEARKAYSDFYSTQRIRELAGSRKGSHHHDLWQLQSLIFRVLGNDSGCSDLALPALGSFLWSESSVKDLSDCCLTNRSFLSAVFALAYTDDAKSKRAVDFKNLRTEELGSVYEALLEMHPQVDLVSNKFGLFGASGSERKKTGSYYTPASLVSCLLDSAMNPLIKKIADKTNAKELLLNLKICDPACGSGHFLLAAANRLARAVAAARSEDGEPSPDAYRIALRDVISNCIYGVDLNEMSVELCKVNLWLESVDSEWSLSFLENKIKCGNSLIGTTPELISNGIVDDAFDAIEGDDKEVANRIKKANREQATGQLSIAGVDRRTEYGTLVKATTKVTNLSDSSFSDLSKKEEDYRALISSKLFEKERFVCDAWCASFVWKLIPKMPTPITRELFSLALDDPTRIPVETKEEVLRLREQYKFFHWHLEFPEVFLPLENSNLAIQDTKSGFDVVLGNPPWERLKIQKDEWFKARIPEIASARTASIRTRMITDLERSNEILFLEYAEDRRKSEGESHFVRKSRKYPLCGRGDVNTYSVFAECNRALLNANGRVGMIVPTGISTDDTTKFFFQHVIRKKSLVSLFSFENEEFIFPAVHHATKFCLLTLSGADETQEKPDFVFFARQVKDLDDEERHFSLTAADFELLSPNTGTCPIFRNGRAFEITKRIYENAPIAINDERGTNPWELRLGRMFDMANDSGLFTAKEDLDSEGYTLDGNCYLGTGKNSDVRFLPLYEAKMFHQFDSRFGTYVGQTEAQARQGKLPELTESDHANPLIMPLPRHWVKSTEVQRRLENKWDKDWLIGWRDITSAVSTRTLIVSILPRTACGDTILLMFPGSHQIEKVAALISCLNSIVVDFAARQKIGGNHLKYHVFKQLPVLAPESFDGNCAWERGKTIMDWFSCRALELIYNDWSLSQFAKDSGFIGDAPFVWNGERRQLLKNEIDAAFFILYGLSRDQVEFVLESFPLVRKKDEAIFGDYKTKNMVLGIYDAMSKAIMDSKDYATVLDPCPGAISLTNRTEHQPSKV